MTVNPITPPISPALRMALGKVRTPIPMFPLRIWIMVSKLEIVWLPDRSWWTSASSTSLSSSIRSVAPSMTLGKKSSSSSWLLTQIEIVLRLKRSTSSNNCSLLDVVRCLRRPTVGRWPPDDLLPIDGGRPTDDAIVGVPECPCRRDGLAPLSTKP